MKTLLIILDIVLIAAIVLYTAYLYHKRLYAKAGETTSILQFLNYFIFQWFFIRIFRSVHEGVTMGYGVIYFVYPKSGWGNDFKAIGKLKYRYFN